jgi:hypothetical protein
VRSDFWEIGGLSSMSSVNVQQPAETAFAMIGDGRYITFLLRLYNEWPVVFCQ